MMIESNEMRSGAIMLCGCAMLFGCSAGRVEKSSPEPVGESTASLLGAFELKSCSETQERMMSDAWMVGKVVSQDPVFRDCVIQAPYIPCDDDGDPQVSTALSASRSPNDMRVHCEQFSNPSTAGHADAVHDPLHEKKEEISVSERVLDDNASRPLRVSTGNVAGIIWHEVMHTHDFQHGLGSDPSTYAAQCGQDPKTWNAFEHSMPYIVEDCMRLTAWDMVRRRFFRDLDRPPTDAEEEFFFGEMASGNITGPVFLTHAITRVNAPSNVRAGEILPNRIEILWDDNSSNETRFEVIGRRGSSSLLIPTADENAESATARNLSPGVEYTFKVRACNKIECSPFSSEVAIRTTSSLPEAPHNFQVDAVESTRVALSWGFINNGNSVTRYELAWTGGSPSVYRSTTLLAGATSHWVEHLDPNESYLFNLQACNSTGCSTSSFRTARTLPLVALPPALSNLRVVSNTPTEVSLSWENPGPTVVAVSQMWRIELHWLAEGSGSWSVIHLPYGSTEYDFQKPFSGAIYRFHVRACNIGGCSPLSNQASAF